MTVLGGVEPIRLLVRLVALPLLSAAVTMAVAFLWRARTKAAFPDGATVLVGVGTVALYLNGRLALVQFLGEEAEPLAFANVVLSVATFVLAAIAAFAGRRLGDETAAAGRFSLGRFQPDLSPIVRATGRFITVEIPEEIEDIEGYDPVPPETKQALAGLTVDFPRGLSVEELGAQLASRLKEKHNVGYVDVELRADATVKHLALGQRATGLGPTLPPGSAAVVLRADPPLAASPGDQVNVWRPGGPDEEGEWIGRGELRASREGLATIATQASVARRIGMDETYRLMTLSADVDADREFAAMLRRGDETMSIVELTETSPLVGTPIGQLSLSIVAIETAEGTTETLPTADRAIRAGDRLHAIGRPEQLRQLKAQPGSQVHDPLAAG